MSTDSSKSAPWGPRRSFGFGTLDGYIWLWGGTNDETLSLQSDVWRSRDGRTWELVTSKAPWTSRMINNNTSSFRNRLWVIGGGGNAKTVVGLNDIWSSVDGKNWEKVVDSAPFPARIGAYVFSMECGADEYIFVYGGLNDNLPEGRVFYRDLWRSKDGKNWELVHKEINDKIIR